MDLVCILFFVKLLYMYVLAASFLASRGFAPRRLIKPIFCILDLKEKFNKKNSLSGGGGGGGRPHYFSFSFKKKFFFGGVGSVPPPKKIVINIPGSYEKLPCKGEPDWFSS